MTTPKKKQMPTSIGKQQEFSPSTCLAYFSPCSSLSINPLSICELCWFAAEVWGPAYVSHSLVERGGTTDIYCHSLFLITWWRCFSSHSTNHHLRPPLWSLSFSRRFSWKPQRILKHLLVWLGYVSCARLPGLRGLARENDHAERSRRQRRPGHSTSKPTYLTRKTL
jgi:hypothetical protein